MTVERQTTETFALLHEIGRRYRQDLLIDPRWWLEQVIAGTSLQEMVGAVEELIGHEGIDISQWVMEELPTHEAHFIDSDSDLIRGFCLSALLLVDPEQPPPTISIGDSLRARIDRVRHILGEMREETSAVADKLGLVQAADRFRLLSRAIEQAVDLHDREQRDLIRRSPLDHTAAARILSALVEAWQQGFPREMTISSGVPITERAWRRGRPYLGIRRLELRSFFIQGEARDETMAMFGDTWALAFSRGESEALINALQPLPAKTWRRRGLTERIDRAARSLTNRGTRGTHLLLPMKWQVIREMESSPGFRREFSPGRSARIGDYDGLAAYQVHDLEDAYVLSLPAALRMTQELMKGEAFRVTIEDIQGPTLESLRLEGIQDVEGAEQDTPQERMQMRVLVDIREAVRYRVVAGAAVKITVPGDLLKDT